MIARSEIPFYPPVTTELISEVAFMDGEQTELAVAVRRAQGGDVEAFAEVLRHCEQRVFHFVLRMLRNAHDAEDVTQDTFVKAWSHLAGFRPQSSFTTWLFTIARRTALNHLRARRSTQELAEADEPVHEYVDYEVSAREEADCLWKIARRLKPEQYEVLWLRYGEGFTIDEIARIMNTNSIRVRVLLHRARKRMAERLKDKSPELRGAL